MNFVTQAITYLLIANLALPGAGCQCLSDKNAAMNHGSDHVRMHEPTHAEHTTSHHAQAKDKVQVQVQVQEHSQALDPAQTHTCLQETCAKDTTALSEVVAPSHHTLFIAWHEGDQTEGEYTAHIIALAFFDIARAPPEFAPPDNPSNTAFESPLSRFDRLII
ncbi:hypothetical protein N8862_01775 [Pseudomonadales bacterium]|nr:hypothetical protein [Pseudomonadales bacterium]